ncbi:MAG TPA: hypothetical protein VLG68_04165 [Gammaproteobacteria bacterium]|nr:hypothetical protein [Gammaproteobacteria bacterium]
MPVSTRAAADRSGAARRRLFGLVLALTVAALGGCASLTYTDVMHQVDQDLAAQHPQAALKSLDKLSGAGDRTLYLLNKAMVQRMAGDYAGSVQSFEQVKPVMAYLEATSVSETAGALTLSEGLRSYTPPLYERLLAHVYEGLDYLQLGQTDAARVEVLQIDDLLKRLYPNADAAPNGGDAFPRYFSGLVYESRGEYSDAMIAYRQAYQAYKAGGVSDAAMPSDLKQSLCRFADYLGLKDERDRYAKTFGLESWPPVQTDDPQGQVVFIFSDGLGPGKDSKGAYLQNPLNGRFYNLTLPVLQRREPGVGAAEISVAGRDVRSQRVANIAADASRQLEADKPKLLADEFARNVTRELAANAADRKGQGLGTLLSFVGAVLDQADTRIWGTLPDNIQLARLRLAPGTYDMTVQLEGGAGRIGSKVLKDVAVQAGQTTFTALQWVSYH